MQRPELHVVFKIWAHHLYNGIMVFSILFSVDFLMISINLLAFLVTPACLVDVGSSLKTITPRSFLSCNSYFRTEHCVHIVQVIFPHIHYLELVITEVLSPCLLTLNLVKSFCSSFTSPWDLITWNNLVSSANLGISLCIRISRSLMKMFNKIELSTDPFSCLTFNRSHSVK